MREQRGRLEKSRVRFVAVLQATAEQAARFCRERGVEGLCIGDPERASYHAMGFPRTSWLSLLRPSAALSERRRDAQRGGHRVSLSGTLKRHSDILQLPGAALIECGGRVLWLHRARHPGDLPLPAELATMAERMIGSRS